MMTHNISNTTRTRMIKTSKCDFAGIHVNNQGASGVTVVVSDVSASGTSTPWAIWFVAKVNGTINENSFFPKRPARMLNGCWAQLLGAAGGVTATIFTG